MWSWVGSFFQEEPPPPPRPDIPLYKTDCHVPEEFQIPREDLAELRVEQTELGRGGFTVVYRGSLGYTTLVAVKTWQQELVGDYGIVFQQEVDALSHVQRSGGHPYVVQFYGANMYWKYAARIVLEYCPGGTLRDVIASKRAKQREILGIYTCIAEAVAWLHSLSPKIIHRDLKATNIFMCEGLIPKLGDFGLAKMKAHTHRKPGVSVSLVDLTSPSGTRMWMAPELLDEVDDYSESCDAYSFGITLMESLYPMWSISAMQVPKEKVSSQFGMVEKPCLPTETDPEFAALVQSCCSLDPYSRPPFVTIACNLAKMRDAL